MLDVEPGLDIAFDSRRRRAHRWQAPSARADRRAPRQRRRALIWARIVSDSETDRAQRRIAPRWEVNGGAGRRPGRRRAGRRGRAHQRRPRARRRARGATRPVAARRSGRPGCSTARGTIVISTGSPARSRRAKAMSCSPASSGDVADQIEIVADGEEPLDHDGAGRRRARLCPCRAAVERSGTRRRARPAHRGPAPPGCPGRRAGSAAPPSPGRCRPHRAR